MAEVRLHDPTSNDHRQAVETFFSWFDVLLLEGTEVLFVGEAQ